jgi:putative membrane-bound dehydrogenase-like protein
MRYRLREAFVLFVTLLLAMPAMAAEPLRLLFLGDNAGHQPAERFRILAPVLAKRGIQLTYTDKVEDLNPQTLGQYAGLIIYANHTKITPAQEKALLDFVASGKGFVPLHCASYCFLNSPAYIALVGAQFRSHGAGVFRTRIVAPQHPLMKGYTGFSSWDETYVHTKHNPKDRTVLEVRAEGKFEEPWTWVRTHGKGRVFYTAWGHDERTWSHPGFQNLVERGIRWACNADLSVVPDFSDGPTMTRLPANPPPFRYTKARVPFYPAGERWGTTREPLTQMQMPLSPAESMQHMVHPDDFELKLFASEEMLGGKPICINWDERGRLWAALTMDYPNELQPAGKGRDRIVIAEDTNGDGVADKVTVFADKLSIPTSLTFARGGVIVHQAPQTLFLADTNGDDVADVRKVLFQGWNTNDTHAGPSNLVWGLDNWIYSMVGYAGFNGTVGGERHNFRQGFFRFKPDGSKLEFLRSANNNCWGVGFSEEGLLFGSTANGNPSMYLPLPNRYYESVRGWSSSVLGSIAADSKIHPITDKIRQVDHHGGFTAAAGHALYTARSYPRYYWNRTAFVTEPTGHLVATFVIERQGSDFRSRNSWNLLASDDEWVAPIMAEVGPDGQVWILDWYNFIVQHNPTPVGFKTGKGNAYETELRDKKHGRIYRLVHKNGTASKSPSLKAPAEMVAALKHDNLLWRRHAQRLLVERGQKDVVPSLLELIKDRSVDDIGLNPGAIHALWTLEGLSALEEDGVPQTIATALKHPSAGVRRNAALVLPVKATSAKAILEAGLLTDADAHVRLAAYQALADQPSNREVGAAIAAALSRKDDMTDRWIPDAVTSAAAKHAAGFLEAVALGKEELPSRAMQIVDLVTYHYAAGGPTESLDALLTAVAKAQPARAEAMLAGLARGWKSANKVNLNDSTEQALAKLLPTLSAAGKASLLRLGASLGSKGMARYGAEVVKALVATVANDKAPDSERLTAARQIMELQPNDETAVTGLLDLITPRSSPSLVAGLLEAVSLSKAAGVGAAIVERMGSWTPSARSAGIRALLSRPASTGVLLDAIDKGSIKLGELALDQKQALAGHPDRALADRARKLLARGGEIPSPDRQKVIDRYLPLLKRNGDAVKGKLVFKNQCAKCHQHSGEGVNIGPDLTGMAAHPREELLVHIMDPNRSVEGNFRLYVVSTNEGRIFTGMLASETRTSIELIDTEAKRITLQRDNIDEISASEKSLMPEGFEKQLKDDEVLDLLEFLTQRGKYLPLPLDKAATTVSTKNLFFDSDSDVEKLIFPDWKPKVFKGVPFQLIDPRGDRVPNVILLYGPQGQVAPRMPRSVSLPCNSPAKAIHFLSGVSGWGWPASRRGSVSMIVRLHYEDGKQEDHSLINGEHFADYIRRVDVPSSEFAFQLRGQQLRYFAVTPKRSERINRIELLKGKDSSAPLVVAVTVETQ